MANRTVNVTINYKVNTAEVVRAQTASRAAQKATDDLRKSSDQYGKSASQAHRQNTDGARQAQLGIASLSREVNSLYNSVRLLLTAGIVREAITLTLEMAKLNGQVVGVTTAFNRLPNATLLLNNLRKATHGAVTDLELMQRALMARNFRIPLENLAKLLEFAAVKAQQTGQEVNHLINYIVSGIGYKQIRRLDDLGFTLIRMRDALGGISLQAATVPQVMDAVTKLINEDLSETGGFLETTKTQVEQLQTAWHDLGVEVSKQGTSTGLIGFLKEATNSMRIFVKAFPAQEFKDIFQLSSILGINFVRRVGDTFFTWHQNLKRVVAEEDTLNRALEESNKIAKESEKIVSPQGRITFIQQEIDIRKQAIKTYEDQVEANAKLALSFGFDIKHNERREKLFRENIALDANKKELTEIIRVLEEYKKTIDTSNESDEEAIGIIQEKIDELERLNEAILASRNQSEIGPEGTLIKEREALQKEIDRLQGKTDKDEDKRLKDKERRERESAKNSANLQEYFYNLRKKKEAEVEEESFRIAEDAARRKQRLMEEEAEKRKELQREILVLSEQLLRSGVDLLTNTQSNELDRIRDYYDEQIELAGDNERAKKELRIKQERELEKEQLRQKEADKKAAEARIKIDGLVAIAKIFGQFGWPAGIGPAAIMAAITAVNLANVRKYKKGEINIDGPGTSTSDSIPAMLSRGESVMTAEETRKSMGLLTAIRANKIDDRILKGIDFSGGRQIVQANMNDERIVSELKAIRSGQYQLEEQGRILYRLYKDSEGNKRRIRSKSI